jgi:hypothetical protein
VSAPEPSFAHLARLTDEFGILEHADHAEPRRAHGYCTDDAARLLVVACREPDPSPAVSRLTRTALRFVIDAQGVAGHCRNRRDERGKWRGRYGVEDCWGRSLWGFGTAATRSPQQWMRDVSLGHFERGAEQRSPWPRAMAFAALGASEVVASIPNHRRALSILEDAADLLRGGTAPVPWLWPEPRLAYANAVLPEALVAAGTGLGRPDLIHDGLALLAWLLEHETRDGHLSVTPAGGSGPADPRPAFDQQPIEVASLADACARAARVSSDERWSRGLGRAVDWFLGDNDAGVPMWDPVTGGGHDGLHADGRNANQGAESTLALVSTLQHARYAVPVAG